MHTYLTLNLLLLLQTASLSAQYTPIHTEDITAQTPADTIRLSPNQYGIDHTKRLIVTNADVALLNQRCTAQKSAIQLDQTYTFAAPVQTVEIGTPYTILPPHQENPYTLYFTQLPLIQITTKAEIVNEPDVLAHFSLTESNQPTLSSLVGIQYRGSSTQALPKKSMEIEFWADSTGTTTQDFALLGMVSDDDWNLQALYNEPLRLRSKTNNDLWRMINTLHYQHQEPEAINGIRMRYVELFLNEQYQGLYGLGEKVNRKQLKLKKHQGSIRGELYKGVAWGASTFQTLTPYYNDSLLWGGFEYKYPTEEIDWARLYKTIAYVIQTPNSTLYKGYQAHFEIDNLVDYFLFINLLRATDNTGKNIYLAKYNTDSKYFYVPWDLDGSFGTLYSGANDPTTNDLQSNGLYNKIYFDYTDNGFRQRLDTRWRELRKTLLTPDALMELFTENYDYLTANGLYARESLAWPEYTQPQEHLAYMRDWIDRRLPYLDSKLLLITSSIDSESNPTSPFNITLEATTRTLHIATPQDGRADVVLYNSLGQVVEQAAIEQGPYALPLNHLTPGVYLVKISQGTSTGKEKICLQ